MDISATQIDPSQEFEAMGVDSVAVIDLSNQLEKQFNNVPRTLFFEVATISEIAAYLQQHNPDEVASLLSTQSSISEVSTNMSLDSDELNEVNSVNQRVNTLAMHTVSEVDNNEIKNVQDLTQEQNTTSDSKAVLETYLIDIISKSSNISADELNSTSTFEDIGVDSVDLIELNNQLDKVFPTLPRTLFFEVTTIADLSEYLISNHKTEVHEIVDKATITTINAKKPSERLPDSKTAVLIGGLHPIKRSLVTESRSVMLDSQLTQTSKIEENSKKKISQPGPSQTISLLETDDLMKRVLDCAQNRQLTLDAILNVAETSFLDEQPSNDSMLQQRESVNSLKTLPHKDALAMCVPTKQYYTNRTRPVQSAYLELLFDHVYVSANSGDVVPLSLDDKSRVLIPFQTFENDVLLKEISEYCEQNNLTFIHVGPQNDAFIDDGFIGIPIATWQDISLENFTVNGAKMRKLRYLVNRFIKAGDVDFFEITPDTPVQHSDYKRIFQQWVSMKGSVAKHSISCMNDLLSWELPVGYRAFATTANTKVCTVMVITPFKDGYLLDQEFYDLDFAELGHLEYSIVELIELLKSECKSILSLGMTLDPFTDSIQNAFQNENVNWFYDYSQASTQLKNITDAGKKNYQFKKKFNVVGHALYAYIEKKELRSSVLNYYLLFFQQAASANELDKYLVKADYESTSSSDSTANQRKISLRADQIAESAIDELDSLFVPFDLQTDSWYRSESSLVIDREQTLRSRIIGAEVPSIKDIVPFDFVFFTSLGRVAENILFNSLTGIKHSFSTVPWTTTLLHQQNCGIQVVEIAQSSDTDSFGSIFTANIDIPKLVQCLQDNPANSIVSMEAFNNAVGGMPVRPEHLHKVSSICKQRNVPLVLDASRVLRNACAVMASDPALARDNPLSIVSETMRCADHVVMSLSKDFGVSFGGLIATNDSKFARALALQCKLIGAGLTPEQEKILTMALLDTDWAVEQIKNQMCWLNKLSQELLYAKVPLVRRSKPMQPTLAGHALLIDASDYKSIKSRAQSRKTLVNDLYIQTGIRGGLHQCGQQQSSLAHCIRLAFPLGTKREVYEEVGKLLTFFYRT